MATFPTSFDRTYEGLKLAPVATPEELAVAFDRTYEGLKHLLPRPGKIPLDDF